MGGKHAEERAHADGEDSDRSTRLVSALSVVGVALLIVVGTLVTLQVRSTEPTASSPPSAAADPTACPEIDGGPVDVAVTPDLVAVLARLVEGCDAVELRAAPSADVSAALAAGPARSPAADLPEVWVPDSSLWLLRSQPDAGDPAADDPDTSPEPVEAVTPEVVAESLAVSPVVVAARAGRDRVNRTWRRVVADPGLKAGDPLRSTTALAPVVGARSEALDAGLTPAQISADLADLARRVAGRTGPTPDDEARLRAAVDSGGAAAVSEQAVIAADLDPDDVALSVPRAGTLVLDYPAVSTASGERRRTAFVVAAWLGAVATARPGVEVVTDAGFRAAPLGPPLAVGLPEARPLRLPDIGLPADAAAAWAQLVLPTRLLAVVDVSSSMGRSAGADTRVGLAAAATAEITGSLPATATVGLWGYSTALAGPADHLPLATLAPLGAPGSAQRGRLETARAELRALAGAAPGDDAGLHDTVLAAYRAVRDGWVPGSVNAVAVLTDGGDSDPDGRTLEELLAALAGEVDPARPVAVLTVALTDDAGPDVLDTLDMIAAATGGSSQTAEPPEAAAEALQRALTVLYE